MSWCEHAEIAPTLGARSRVTDQWRARRTRRRDLCRQAEMSQDSINDGSLIDEGHEAQPAPHLGNARMSKPNVRCSASARARNIKEDGEAIGF